MFLTSRESVSLLCLSLVFSQNAVAQQSRPTKSTQRAATSIGPKVEEEILRLDRGSYSSVFSKLSEPGSLAELDLSAKQKSLIRRLDDATRAILRGWLLRGQDQNHPRDPVVRLSDEEVLREGEILAHSGAVALQGILTASQAAKLRSNANAPEPSTSKSSPGRADEKKRPSPKRSTSMGLTREEIAELKSEVQSEARALLLNQDHASGYFSSLTEKTAAPALELSPEQSELLNRLDQLTRAIIQDWLLRGLDAAVLPSDMADRLSDRGVERRNQIVLHAEAIARLGILTPAQVEKSNKLRWKQQGSMALLDPELGARLRLSPEQREEIANRLANKRRVQEVSDRTLGMLRSKVYGDDARIGREADLEVRRRIDQADDLVWDVLDPIQMDTLVKLVNPNVSPRRRPK